MVIVELDVTPSIGRSTQRTGGWEPRRPRSSTWRPPAVELVHRGVGGEQRGTDHSASSKISPRSASGDPRPSISSTKPTARLS